MSSLREQADEPLDRAKRADINHVDEPQLIDSVETVVAEDQSSAIRSPVQAEQTSHAQAAHQRLVFTDPVAFRYLEEDPSTTVLERRRELTGYEVYVVEQWACSRVDPTFVITTFTGLPQHIALVAVLSVPTDENEWSPRLRVYLKAINKFHARRKETPLGTLMVTNLSSFPSALTVIPVPGGDVKGHRENFIVNENLKRLGCSGRAGMNLGAPVGATHAKFSQLYRTSDRVPLPSAVIELVKLCQVSLVVFTKLAPEYADGLLCDVTERAINDWWTEIGTEYFNVEPTDGILGPTTVAALIGMLLGARNRLNACGAPVGKEVFDLKAIKRGIAYFQKSQRLAKTRRLDRETLTRLHRVTSKAASTEGWTVPRAVKSTVAEFGGKGGEMVMGMVGAREKFGIAAVETLDIGTFIQMVSGERCKWLWHGKPSKGQSGELFGALAGDDEMVFSGDEAGGYLWASKRRDSVPDQGVPGSSNLDRLYLHSAYGSQNSLDPTERDQALRKTVFKSVTDKMSDARSGLGRFKDAVGIPGLRGHYHKLSKEEHMVPNSDGLRRMGTKESQKQADTATPTGSPKEPLLSVNADQKGSEPGISSSVDSYSMQQKTEGGELSNTSCYGKSTNFTDKDMVLSPGIIKHMAKASTLSNNYEIEVTDSCPRRTAPREQSAWLGSRIQPAGVMIHERVSLPNLVHRSTPPARRSMQSLNVQTQNDISPRLGYRWPRYLSFSVVDDVLRGALVETADSFDRDATLESQLANQRYLSLKTKRTSDRLRHILNPEANRVKINVRLVEGLDRSTKKVQEDLDAIFQQKSEELDALREATRDLVMEEKSSLTEALKDIDVSGAKLEYELSALRSKVDDVEDGVTELERQVLELEARAQDLEKEERSKHSWISRLVKHFIDKT
ncbi:hypothetical protein MMC13_008223 [Lambiella insularis]|nr:hypothetical protein [Lambiella insularis]